MRNPKYPYPTSICKACGKEYRSAPHRVYCRSVECEKERRRKISREARAANKERALADSAFGAKRVYTAYKTRCKKSGREFTLTPEYFHKYWNSSCHYCGDKLPKIGFDRVDNDKGYTEDNVVPCCEICNKMKHVMGYDEFIKRCELIAIRLNDDI
jgi:hypothetical protein